MSAISGATLRYKVCWRRGTSQHQPFAAFDGDGAWAKARALYERLLAEPDVVELRLSRLDGDTWVWHIPPLRRNEAGEWGAA